MMTYISILRGINVGGHRKILMAELRKMYQDLGFSEVQTYIQSGNVIFKSDKFFERTELELLLENQIQKIFGHDVPVIIRTQEEWKKAASENPFLQNSEGEKEQLCLTFLKKIPDSKLLQELENTDFTPDKIKMIEDHAYIYVEGKYHESPLTNAFIEKKLNVKATTRNWKTVEKLLELSSSK